jgi:uncharacterized membrane protein YkvA (DUF1232 family)
MGASDDAGRQLTPGSAAPPDRIGRLPLILALVYDVLPVDLVADVVPVMGLVDDAGVTGVALMLAGRAWWMGRASATALAPLVVAAVYAILPIDLVPDVVPLLGRTDDAVVALMAVVMGWWQRDEREVGR